MRFSVIVPVYNVESYIADCLDSLLNQTFADWEAVCVDDGSTDGSRLILSDYAARDSRIRIITQPNGGPGAARNTGLDAAQGEYVLFLDSDDWLEPSSLQIINDNLHGEDMLCFGGWQGEGEELPIAGTYSSGWEYYNAQALLPHKFSFVCVVLRCYRRAFLEKQQLRFRDGILHEDNHFTPRVCLSAGRVSVIPKCLYHYRVRPGSIMTSRTLRNRQDMIRVANDLSAFFTTQTNNIDHNVIFRALAQYYQAAFWQADSAASHRLRPTVDWEAYRRVSRGRLRHRLNYGLLRISPRLYNAVGRVIESLSRKSQR